jgi:uncharacterized LabA/DUF88 family protein
MADQRRLALLIDGDNAQASLLGQMLAETSKYGVVTIRRVYGDWTTPEMKSWKQALHVYALQPVQQFRYTVGKNATDSAMIIDAMDVLYTAGVDGFCLVSSDSDYTRLATRIREKNLFVMGIGRQTTPRAFVNACDVFVYTENLQAEESGVVTAPPDTNSSPVPTVRPDAQLSDDKDAPLKQLFRTAFELSVQENGWASLSMVGNKLRQLDPGFDPRTYGHRQLLLLLQAHPELFDIKRTKKSGRTNIAVRLREDA